MPWRASNSAFCIAALLLHYVLIDVVVYRGALKTFESGGPDGRQFNRRR
jgi:hypothetical protein